MQSLTSSNKASENIMQSLVNYINKSFNQIKLKAPITNPSIPVLYFGDLEVFKKSSIKIITVGLNPSHKEFPQYARAHYHETVLIRTQLLSNILCNI